MEINGFWKRDKVKIVLGRVIKIEKRLEPCENNGFRNWRFRQENR